MKLISKNIMHKSSGFTKILEDAQIVQKDFSLCDSCLGRLFVKRLSLSSNQLLGKKIHKKIPKKKSKCYICKDLIDNLDSFHSQIFEKIKDFQFNTFLVGAILKPSIVERDDLIRSKYHLKGIDSVKTDISRQLAKKLSQKTKSKIDHLKPELTITVNFKNNSIELYSKAVILAGRYTKNSRNLPQKQQPCKDCKGKGCLQCDYHGITDFDSVEGKISKFLFEKFSAKQVKITWIGGEDKTSLVKGKGRPFFAQIINPSKRKIRFSKTIKIDEISISGLKQIPSIPKTPLKFRSKIELLIETEEKLPSSSLKKLGALKNSQIAIYEESKRIEKSIHSIKYSKINPNSYRIQLEIDGGVPIKKFVDSETVFPNLSDLLDTKCVCKQFDFNEIFIQ